MTKVYATLALAMTGAVGGWASQKPPARGFTIRQMVAIKFPSSPVCSPDGRNVIFVWDNEGIYNLYLVSTSGKDQPRQLTFFSPGADAGAPLENELSGGFWGRDSRVFYFPYHGQLWQIALARGRPKPVWPGLTRAGDFVLSPDGTRVAYVQATGQQASEGADLIVRSLHGVSVKKLAHNPNSIFGILWSPDGKHLAYTAGSLAIPHEKMPAYVGTKLIFVATEHTPGNLYVVPSSGGRPVSVGIPGGVAARWIDDNHLVFEKESGDHKRRMIYVTGIVRGSPRLIHQDVESKFWSMPYDVKSSPQPSPDGRWIAFLSDTDGWDHLYVMPSTGGKPVKITHGEMDVWRPIWSHDSSTLAFDTNSGNSPGDRQLAIAVIGNDPSHATITYITHGRGTNIAPVWLPDDRGLVYQHTDLEDPADLFVISARGGEPARLTESLPSAVDRSQFVAPEFVHYPGAHGQMVPAWLFLPKDLDRSKKHAAIVWVHGDGVNQNYDGWHVERHYAIYYAMNQYLLQEGYVILAPDYRGSIGYGRSWRTGVYDSVGVDDETDVADAASYLKTLPYVDPSRLGIWGLSYGGFFTLQTVTEHPTLFRAAIDIAGVADFAMYYEDPYHDGWIASRLDGSPAQNPEGYANAAPVRHVEQLQRPLLILAGTADLNVPFIETVRLVDQLLKHGKGSLITFMMYPGEFHYFDRGYVLRDAWRRVDQFFRTTLKPGAGL